MWGKIFDWAEHFLAAGSLGQFFCGDHMQGYSIWGSNSTSIFLNSRVTPARPNLRRIPRHHQLRRRPSPSPASRGRCSGVSPSHDRRRPTRGHASRSYGLIALGSPSSTEPPGRRAGPLADLRPHLEGLQASRNFWVPCARCLAPASVTSTGIPAELNGSVSGAVQERGVQRQLRGHCCGIQERSELHRRRWQQDGELQ